MEKTYLDRERVLVGRTNQLFQPDTNRPQVIIRQREAIAELRSL